MKNVVFWDEDRGDTFLRNVGSQKIYTTTHPRRRPSSLIKSQGFLG
jgi:hypothetical protein